MDTFFSVTQVQISSLVYETKSMIGQFTSGQMQFRTKGADFAELQNI